MKFVLTIECNCGNVLTETLKRKIEEYDGKVYEDYTSITESMENNKIFNTKQYHEDTIYVKCLKCGNEHELQT